MTGDMFTSLIGAIIVIAFYYGSFILTLVAIWSADIHWFVKFVLTIYNIFVNIAAYNYGKLLRQKDQR